MKIGLISDTHIPDRGSEIPKKVFDAFKDVDLILHAGDITSLNVLKELEKIAPTEAIQGNMDRSVGLKLPKSKVMTLEGKKVGIIHGEVYPRGDSQQLYYTALELRVDILVSGHSHIAQLEKVKDIVLVNPGSPIAPRLSDPSVAVMTLTKENIEVEFIKTGSPVCSALNFFSKKSKNKNNPQK